MTPPGPEAEPSGDTTRTRGAGDQAERVLRRTRRLTDVFAWFTAVGVLASALSPGRHGTLGVVAAVLVVVVLICWATGHPRQEWWLVGVEAVTVAVGCFALAAVEPLLGLLFGLTTRRAARGRLGRYALKGAPPLAAYLVGVLNVRLGAGADQLAPVLLPLVGLVIGSIALGDTISAVSFARAAGRANAAAHERLSAIVRTTPVALVVVDPTNRVTLSNDLARELITACGGDEHHVPCPHGIDAFACAHGCLDALRTTGRTEWTYGHTESPRTVAVYGTSTADEHGQPTQLWALVDISDTKALEDELRRRLERDHLTGVVSREHFAELLQSTLDGNPGGRLALLVVDLDNFKEINDAFGHPLGDVFLIASARQLRHTVGTAGVVGRLGGDEFAVLAVDHDEHDAAALAARVLTALSSVRQVEGYTSALTASIGIVTAGPGQDDTATVLLRDADTAMYVAKRAGGGRAEIFRPEFRTRLLDRQEREAELRRAIADEQFELHYQPIVDLPTGAITGVEALIRWQHPERGMLPPGPVIQLAEDTGLIIPLGEWALRTACRQSALWTAQGVQLRISVNISAGQLYETDFVGTVRNTLAETGASADRIMLELTESTLMHSSALTVLRDIQDLGVRIALDDFGTGYSSLSYLQTHPFDVIKVDRSFVLQLGSTATAEGIVRCVLQLASVLGTPVVAEGVETPEQARFLLQAGCALAQGYLFGKPAPPAELARSLTASSTI